MRYRPIYNPQKRVSLFAKISFVIFFLSVSLLVLSKRFVSIADFLNSMLSSWVRRGMAWLTDFMPFSLFEILVILIPVWIALVIILAIFAAKRGRRLRFLINLFAIALLIYSHYIVTLGIAYGTTPVSLKMGLADTEVTEEKLAEIMVELRDEANALSAEISYMADGASSPDYSFREMSEKICASYAAFSDSYGFPMDFSSHAKPIYFGNVMSCFSLTGIYTFYTGEANVNSAYPMYDMAFTASHELSHQRGVMRENEANFMAYVVNSTSPDPYLRYSAALSMYEYIGSALYRTNKDLYFEIAVGLADGPKRDILSSYAVSQKYGDTFLSDISDFLNDLFLKSNGTAGVITYSQVVNLTVAYFEQMK